MILESPNNEILISNFCLLGPYSQIFIGERGHFPFIYEVSLRKF